MVPSKNIDINLSLSLSNSISRQKLTIYKLHPDDSGKYFCRVNETETSAWLEVTRR